MTTAGSMPLKDEMVDNELPQGWQRTQLGEVVWPSKEKVEPDEHPEAPYLGLEHIESCTSKVLGQGRASDVKSTKAVFRGGDVLYGKLRPYLSKVCVPDFSGVCSTDLLVFDEKPWLKNKFLLWFLLRREVVEYANHHSTGVELPRISYDALASLDFLLPPLTEQNRIVGRVEDCVARVNSIRDRLSRVGAILRRFRQAVLTAAVSGRLTEDWREKDDFAGRAEKTLATIFQRREAWLKQHLGNSEARRTQTKLLSHTFSPPQDVDLPEGWVWSSLQKACWLVVDCHNKTAPYKEHGIPLVRTTNIKMGRLLLDEVKYVSEETYQYWSRRCQPQPGDILFTREAPMGECSVIPTGTRLCMGQRMMLFRVFQDLLSSDYLSFAIQEPRFQQRLYENAVGSGVRHLRVGDVEKLVFPVPPTAEQQEIVRRVKTLFVLADLIETRCREAQERTSKLTQSILAKAFRGELVPTEAELARREGREYEPASVLLERIRKERDSQTSTKPEHNRTRSKSKLAMTKG
jgi:type I restriction enzyme S subunit